ncbi:hypothetical protein D805_0697 [Bifidobacterium thermophilum RBL67]|uniref:Uncharacterized protein n=1 Tax=Bifidobacterium thermophilum RBL67 TaxID=1254439 RepID=M4RFM5_9BIFI|nr:hypothetical protein D805_0697 [Bifidobacterium thermophilum RBL67]
MAERKKSMIICRQPFNMYRCISIILRIEGNLTDLGISQFFHLFFREFLVKPVPDVIRKSPTFKTFRCLLRNTHQQNIYGCAEQSCCRTYCNIIFVQMM